MPVPNHYAHWEFMIPGDGGVPNIKLTASAVGDDLPVTVSFDAASGRIADLRGLFFNVLGDAHSTLTVTGSEVTNFASNTID